MRFARHPRTGKWMILDAKPDDLGNVVVVEGDEGQEEVMVFKSAAEARAAFPGEPLYYDHHATCPNAAEWKRKA